MAVKEFIDDIRKAVEVMKNGGIILYPTDTIWGIGCDATSEPAVRKIIEIKKRKEEKSFILLLDHESRINSYVSEVPDQAWQLIEFSEKPLTIIYDGAKNLPPEVISGDGSIAIRVTRDEFCRNLAGALRKPLISTSANISGEKSPSSFGEIDPSIINNVDYVVKWRQSENTGSKPSTIIRLGKGGQIKFIRR